MAEKLRAFCNFGFQRLKTGIPDAEDAKVTQKTQKRQKKKTEGKVKGKSETKNKKTSEYKHFKKVANGFFGIPSA